MKHLGLKSLLIISVAMTIGGCSRELKEMTDEFKLPPELSHCSIHKMSNGGLNNVYLYAVNCPNSTTSTTRSGKHPTRISVYNQSPDPVYIEQESPSNKPEINYGNQNGDSIAQKLIPRPMTPEEYTEYYKRTYRK